MKRYRIGFIGGAVDSIIGQSHHAAAVLDGRWQLTAGSFSRDAKRNNETGATWGVPESHCFENWQEMLETVGSELDVVSVLTPSPAHGEMIKTLINTGVAVISEKPLVTTLQEAREIAQMQKEHSAFVAVTYNYNAYPMMRELRAKVAHGELGDLWHIQVEMPQAGMAAAEDLADVPSMAWRIKDAPGYPPVLTDLATHAIDMARFSTDSWPEEVFAELSSHNPGYPELKDNVRLLLRYSTGLRGSIWASTTATGNRHNMNLSLHGSLAGAHWRQEYPELLHWHPIRSEKQIVDRATPGLHISEPEINRMKPGHPTGFLDGFANVYTDVARCLDNNGQYSDYTSTVEQSVAGLEILEAAMISNREGRWCKVEYSN